MDKRALTTYDIANHCQVVPRTVIQWINEGKLKAYRTPGNHSRVQSEDFVEFLKKYKMPLPAETIMPVSNKKRVLIVDDDKGMVDALQRILKNEKNYDLEIAYNGFEAGEKFSSFKPDLIILDIKMPGLDGFQVCSRIRGNQKSKSVKILLISGNFDPRNIDRVKEVGADDYLEKPFDIKELKEKITHLLGWNRRQEDNVN